MSKTDVSLIKKSYKKEKFTKHEIKEIMKCLDDPTYFAINYFYIQNPSKGRMKLALHEYQKDLIKTFNDYKYSICLMSRQTGKCVSYDTFITYNNSQKKIGKIINLNLKDKIVNILERWLIKLST